MRDTDLHPPRSSKRIAPKAFLEAALDAIVGANQEGDIIEFNPAAERLFGYTRSEVFGRRLTDILLPERTREETLGRFLRTGDGFLHGECNELTCMRSDGREFPAEICVVHVPGGSRARYVAFVRDVTDRKQAEAARRAGEEQLRLVTDALPALVASVDEAGRYVFVNKAYEDWFERPREALLGRPVREIVGEETYQTLQPPIEAALAGQEVIVEAEVPARRGRRWIKAHYVPRRADDGRAMGYVSLVTDITESKRTRDEIQRLNASLEQRVAERTARLEEALAQIDAFAYSVSHDLRAPLRAMRGFSQALLEDYAGVLPDDLSRDYLNRISSAAERMDQLIQDLLAYSRIGRGELRLEPLPLDEVLQTARADLATELRDAQVEAEAGMPSVRAHRTTLVQVLKNLLSNAAKFVAPGVRPRIRVRTEALDGRVRLWVEDNGIGVPQQHSERIFRVFERLHAAEVYPGTGVGLAIVKKGVERMGGGVGVESAPDGGSRFWIDLRRA